MIPCKINPYNELNNNCPNPAVMEIRWSMNFDPSEVITSNICQKHFDERPPFINIVETKRLEVQDVKATK